MYSAYFLCLCHLRSLMTSHKNTLLFILLSLSLLLLSVYHARFCIQSYTNTIFQRESLIWGKGHSIMCGGYVPQKFSKRVQGANFSESLEGLREWTEICPLSPKLGSETNLKWSELLKQMYTSDMWVSFQDPYWVPYLYSTPEFVSTMHLLTLATDRVSLSCNRWHEILHLLVYGWVPYYARCKSLPCTPTTC